MVREVIELLRAEYHGGHHLAAVYLLALVCDDAQLDELGHTAGYELRVHAEVVLLLEELRDGVGYAAYAELYAGPIRNVTGDEAPYAHVLLVGGDVGDDGHGIIGLNEIIHL